MVFIFILLSILVFIFTQGRNTPILDHETVSELNVQNPIPLYELNDPLTIKTATNIVSKNSFSKLPKGLKEKNSYFYTVYTVKDYGKLYLIFQQSHNALTVAENHFVISKTKDDFKQLIIGESFFSDVCKIDTCSAYITGNLNISIHWLEDGSILTIQYEPETKAVKAIDFHADMTWTDNFYPEDC